MIYLILSIVFSTSLFVIFKYFEIYKIHTLKAIVVNYLVAFTIGFLLAERKIPLSSLPQEPWFYGALTLGVMFITIFLVMALTTQRNGVAVVSVAGKMSVVIPIVFGIVLYNESVGFFKIIGIVLALIAVYLVAAKDKKVTGYKKGSLLFPILLFLGSGTIDTTLKYVQKQYVSTEDVVVFSSSLFGFAALFGLLILGINQLKHREAFGFKNMVAGIVLGVPNYYSIVFLIKALQIERFDSSTLFTINNVGIVVVSTLIGLWLFKEQFSLKNKIGILLAIVGIVLVAVV